MKIASNGIRIYVEERGSGELPLVFLHYWGGSHKTWRYVVDALAASYRTIATDHRGWGQSDAPPSGYGLADLAADAEGVIEALALREYVLVGHSMGGKVAQLIASRRPPGLRGLVLVAPSPPPPVVLPAEARQTMAGAYETADTISMTIDHVLTAGGLCPDDRRQVIEDSLRGAPQAKAAWPRSTILEDLTHDVAAIQVPTLVIAGEFDKVDSVQTLRSELMPYIRPATLQVIPETGHLSPLEAPAQVAALIRDFVETNCRR